MERLYAIGRLRTLRILLPVVLLTLISINLQAQNPNGTLRGEVQDASEARIGGAHITLQSEGSSFIREAAVNSNGEFRIEGLFPGRYHIVVEAKGFAQAASDVIVEVSVVRDVSITLQPQSGRETVNVRGSASSITTQPIDTASAVHQGVITTQDLETLPLAARSFANIAYLVPGTEPVEPSDPTKARITAVSTGGSSGLNNELSIDGGDNSDDWIGGFLQNFSPDALQEFDFRTANEDADTGGTTAGSVVITTKRGTNDWHGSASFYGRSADLNARFPIENPAETCTDGVCVHNPKQPFSRQNYIATIGGPIARNKAWVFASFEHVHENASIAYSPASTEQFNALAQIAADGLIPGVTSISVPSTVPIPFRDYLGSLRFDWAQSSKSNWFLRFAEDSYTTHNNLVQQATLPSTGLSTHNNYLNTVISNQYTFSPTWVGSFVFDASELHLTQARNSDFGFALAFPFSSTSLTVSGFETFGDSQFATPITFFPTLRNQEKYQFRYDISHVAGHHAPKFGINFIHEPVLSGAFPGNAETQYVFPMNPTDYINDLAQFPIDYAAGATPIPAYDGSFSQNVQRLALYAEDSWHATPHLTINYGLRWQTTFGLFKASGRDQTANPFFQNLTADGYPLAAPHDYRKQIGPRLGIAYSPGSSERTVLRAGIGMYYNDLAQNGWAPAFQAVNNGNINACNSDPADCTAPPAIIDPRYKTPYSIHITGGIQHAINQHWVASADYVHEDGQHGYRAYGYSDITVFQSNNRSSYNALMLQLRGNVSHRVNLTANYTFSKAETWGCVLGELFDYVNGVCNDPNTQQPNGFGAGDYGPSGEDVRHRFVLGALVHVPGGFEVSTVTQAESARPFTITTADGGGRVYLDFNDSGNPVYTSLDEFRGKAYIQADLRVARPIKLTERWQLYPFAEMFNLFNRNNPGANYVTNVAVLPVTTDPLTGTIITGVCNPTCGPLTSLKQLEIPSGGLGDFFGPGTTVGIPFAAQLGVRVTF
ncbi:MAG TPA: carboxypeptidase regulatory-like domain-containing protein [Terriglobales bacterium]|nr:carboxypeptidase regulatory-like domain-containing protein [Terriglobales bacterium]